MLIVVGVVVFAVVADVALVTVGAVFSVGVVVGADVVPWSNLRQGSKKASSEFRATGVKPSPSTVPCLWQQVCG